MESIILLQDERDPKYRLRKFKNSPYPYISNLEYFSTSIGSWNKELASYGIKSRLKKGDEKTPEDTLGVRIHLIQHSSINYRCNNYLHRQYKRLQFLRQTNAISKYWALSWSLIQHSWSFRIASLNNWMPRWYKELNYSELQKIMRNLERISSLEEIKTTIHNVWIESPKGKYRQLGIPNKAWRLYLHMMNMFLSYIYEPHLPKHLYDGFIYNRGSKSWWEKILWSPLLTTYDWIIEVDFSSGFPNLNLEQVKKCLLEDKLVPPAYITLLMNALTSEVKPAQTYPTLETFIEDHENERWRQSNRSVHMGLGISPILFVITLHWAIKQLGLPKAGMSYLGYADDFSLFFTTRWIKDFLKKQDLSWSDLISNYFEGINPFINYFNNHPIMRTAGFKICEKKSHWVRILGIWITSFNSLGLSLYTESNLFYQLFHLLKGESIPIELKGNTRGRGANPIKGKPSTQPSRVLLKNIGINPQKIITLSHMRNSWKPYFGLIIAKLYGGPMKTSKKSRWIGKIKRASMLGELLKHGLNKSLPKLSKWNEHNSGSKCNKLLLGLIKGETHSKWIRELEPNLERKFKLKWKLKPQKLITELKCPLPKAPYQFHPENDYFSKFSELNIKEERLNQLKLLYQEHQKKRSMST